MNGLPPMSKKRLDRIAAGKVKLAGRSSFERMSMAEVIAAQTEMHSKVKDALFGKEKKTGKTERQRARDLADKYFSEFIRLRDAGADGRVKCITCSHVDHWRQLQCGHYVTRGHQSTRFDERNCNAQCRGCNYNGGRHLAHAAAIELKHGKGTVEALHLKGSQRCSRTTSDYLFLADCYRKKVEEIREKSPGKFLKAA